MTDVIALDAMGGDDAPGAVLDSLGLTVKGRRDRSATEDESPLARLQAAARRQLNAPPRDADQ